MDKIDYQIIGFLLADGCFMIIKNKRVRKYQGKRVGQKEYEFVNYTPRINISQREDNIAVLEYAQKRYGGYVLRNRSFDKDPNYHRVFYWVVQNFPQCLKLAEMTIKSDLPHHKKEAAKVMRDFCGLSMKRKKGKYDIIELEQAQKYYEAIREANTFKAVTSR